MLAALVSWHKFRPGRIGKRAPGWRAAGGLGEAVRAMVKLYVGARRRVFVTGAGASERQLYASGPSPNAGRMAFAILADHLGDSERALSARGPIERIFGARLRTPFWTVTESELAEALARADEAGQ